MHTYKNESYFQWLIRTYFSDPKRWIRLKKGDILLEQGHYNNRLYYIRQGKMLGYMFTPDGQRVEILQAGPGAFVGIYSFFSKNFSSVATVEATEDCELAYIDSHQQVISSRGECSLEQQFMPMVMSDLLRRQQELQRLNQERAQTLKKLLDQQRLASLGQMAAGIAHELNNAVAVLSRNTSWLVEQLQLLCGDPTFLPFFELGLNKGRIFSSREVRARKKQLITQFNLSPKEADLLAQTGLPDDLLFEKKKLKFPAENVYRYWELGATFHDMLVAADQTSHVVNSIRTLGAQHSQRQPDVDINETIKETITLLRHRLRDTQVDLDLQALPPIEANKGELVQLWMNLVQNAIEAMKQIPDKESNIKITSKVSKNFIKVEVSDNGPGIPEEIKNKIFQPNVTTKVSGLSFGLGLGLTIVQRIVTNYNGTIDVNSSKQGTCFTIKIPIGG